MTVVTVTARTIYLQDYAANSDKFYRAYEVGQWAVFQWGRRGTVGQFKAERHAAIGVAHRACEDKLESKRREGYGHGDELTFQFDDTRLDGGKPSCTMLDDVRQAAGGSTPSLAALSSPPPANAPAMPAPRDPYNEFTSRALAAITLAVTNPQKGAEEYALLNAAWPELEELYARAKSYLNTLDSLVIGVTT